MANALKNKEVPKFPIVKRNDGTLEFFPTTKRDALGTVAVNGEEFVVAFTRGAAKVLGRFEGRKIVEPGEALKGKGVILHHFAGKTQFHTFEPIPEKDAKKIERKINKNKENETLSARD
ncbi:MAG: hypothetical protein N3G22_01720 [Candidatus Micrarchaeota archaeon]|nr:hypothetical protein [Candidatus Micrarchaeota archaeon]